MTDNENIGVATEKFDQLICSKCECTIDIRDLEPFTRIECPNCRHPATIPAKFGEFLLLDLIGTGGMGAVFIAEDETLNRLVAIKVMLRSLDENSEAVDTFRREAQAAARLNHPNIAQIYSFGQEKGQPYIVMELVTGKGLDTMIDEGKPLSQGLTMKMSVQVVEALQAADEAGLIHGDIKPENILMTDKGRVKLVDFGLASFKNQAAAEGIWGTPYYIAPEKVRRQKSDARSDIYSLGATLYHALAARPPFEGETPAEVVKARLDTTPEKLSELRPGINQNVENIVLRMLQLQQSRRHPTYASLLSDLKKALSSLSARERGAKPKRGKSSRFKKVTNKSPRVTASIDIPADLPEEDRGKRPKIVIKKRRPSTISAAASSRKSSAATPPPPTKSGKKKEKAKQKKKSKAALWLTLIILLAAIGGVIAFYIRDARIKAVNRRREVFALRDAVGNTSNLYSQVSLSATNVHNTASSMTGLVTKATNAISVIMEQPFSHSLLEGSTLPFEHEPVEEVAGDEEPVEDTPDRTEEEEEEEAPSSEGGMNAPAGIMSRESIERAKGNEPAPDELAEDTEDEETGDLADDEETEDLTDDESAVDDDENGDEIDEGEDEEVVEDEPEEELLIEDMDIKDLVVMVLNAESAIDALAEQSASVANSARETSVKALNAPTSAEAIQENARLTELIENVSDVEQQVSELFDNAGKAADQADKLRKNTEDEREQERLEAERAEEAARKEAERLAALEEHKARVKEERAEATIVQTSCQVLVVQYKFKEAAEKAADKAKSCQTDEGSAAFQVLVDRYTKLSDLKTFLVRKMNTDPQPWIWRGKQDVKRATETTLQLTTTTVEWVNVPIPQMLKFINTYVTGTPSRKVRIRTKCNNLLAAAIFCMEHGGEAAVAAAKNYSNQALLVCPDMEEEVNRLLNYSMDSVESESVDDSLF